MTRAIKATDLGLTPHFKVHVAMPGAMMHLASQTEPVVTIDGQGRPVIVVAEWIDDPAYGDTLGWIDWPAISGITWRWSS